MNFKLGKKEKFKKMMMYAIKKKHDMSGGHNGFKLFDLKPILDELVSEGKIEIKPTGASNVTTDYYFIKNVQNKRF